MTIVVTIHLFQAVYTGHGYFGRFWEIFESFINTFISATHASKYEWIEQPALWPISIKVSLANKFIYS